MKRTGKITLLTLILLFMTSCSKQSAESSSGSSSIATAQNLTKAHGSIPTPHFLYLLAGRLEQAMAMNDAISITVLATKSPIAVSTESGQILLSQGLLTMLNSEAQLCFVIAHELAHLKLHHFDEMGDPDLEKQADALSLMTVYRAGYNIPASLQALNLPYIHTQSHPLPSERIETLQSTLRSLPVSFYGVIDTDEAKEFRNALKFE